MPAAQQEERTLPYEGQLDDPISKDLLLLAEIAGTTKRSKAPQGGAERTKFFADIRNQLMKSRKISAVELSQHAATLRLENGPSRVRKAWMDREKASVH